MQVRLQISNGKANVKQVVLRSDTIIGRSPDCQLKIASSQVSRKHCQITIRDILVSIRDLGSANGTFVNGKALEKNQDLQLTPGSTVVIGPLKFIVQFEGASKIGKQAARKSAAPPAPVSNAKAAPAEAPPEVFAPAVDVEEAEPEIAETEMAESEASEHQDEFLDVEVGFDDIGPLEETLPAPPPFEDFGVADEEVIAEQRADEAAREAEPPAKRRSLFDFFRKKGNSAAEPVEPEPEETADAEVAAAEMELETDVETNDVSPDEETVSFVPEPEIDEDAPELGFPDADVAEDAAPEFPTEDEEATDEDDDLGNFLGQFQ